MEMEVHQVIQDIIRSFCRIATTMMIIFRVQKQAVLLPGDLRYTICCSNLSINCHSFITHNMAVCQNPGNYLVNPKTAGKWMFIPLKMYL